MINGLLAPFPLVGVLLIANDVKIMQRQRGSWVTRGTVALAMVVMFGAAAALFVF